MAAAEHTPDLTREKALWAVGCHHVAGIDEAGRGALAGPVVAAAVVLPQYASVAGVWTQVRDSKLLSPKRRESLEADIRSQAAAWAVGRASAAEVDRSGVAAATRVAMTRAIHALDVEPSHLLIDWVRLPDVGIAQTSWAKADRHSVSVAAASILAKVHRDRLLMDIDPEYPAYGFYRHKGYGTARHLAALSEHGPCPEHRLSFAPVAQCRSLFDLDGSDSNLNSSHARDGRT